MTYRFKRAAATALALSLGFGLAACGGDGPNNRTLYSVKQPVVEQRNFTLDLAANSGGLPVSEQSRLAAWFETLDLRYGDRVALDDPMDSPAISNDVGAIASRHGLLLADGAPVTEGYVNPGNVRVVVTRSLAYVPGCPDWSDQYGTSLGNKTSDGFGCAINGNLAAMIADPQHLLEGAKGTGETTVMTSNRAIGAYRNATPSGNGGTNLPEVSSKGE